MTETLKNGLGVHLGVQKNAIFLVYNRGIYTLLLQIKAFFCFIIGVFNTFKAIDVLLKHLIINYSNLITPITSAIFLMSFNGISKGSYFSLSDLQIKTSSVLPFFRRFIITPWLMVSKT